MIEEKKSWFCYSATKAGKAEASYIVRIKNLLDTIETPGVITMALSKETELGIEKILALKRLILGTTALLQVAWVHWELVLGGHCRKDLATTAADAACVWPVSVRALAESNLEYDTANLLGKSLEEAVLSNKSWSHTKWKYTNCTNAHIYLQSCL